MTIPPEYKENHHILFNRQEWNIHLEGRELRQDPALVVQLPKSTHENIHKHCPPVPILGFMALRMVRAEYQILQNNNENNDYINSVDNLIYALDMSRYMKLHRIEVDLANLAIKALRFQKEFLYKQ